MARHYPKQQVGVADGTETPPLKADGREVGAKKRTYLASKVVGTAWAINDTVFLMRKPASEKIVGVTLTTDTSLGTTTLDIGTEADPDKYVDGKTQTATETPTRLGPLAAAMDDDPADEEEIFLTVLTAAIVAGTVLTFEIETSGL
jgi:hypothetical protein